MPQSGQLIAAWERDMERVACIFKEELAGWLGGLLLVESPWLSYPSVSASPAGSGSLCPNSPPPVTEKGRGLEPSQPFPPNVALLTRAPSWVGQGLLDIEVPLFPLPNPALSLTFHRNKSQIHPSICFWGTQPATTNVSLLFGECYGPTR